MRLFASVAQFRPSWATLIFAVVLLVRLANLARLSRSAFLLPSRGDMHFYNDWAQRILHGEVSHLAFYGLPGYAYLLALLYRIFGYDPFVPGSLQAVLDAVTSVLIYSFTLRIGQQRSADAAMGSRQQFGPQIFASIAALSWAFFVPAEAYSVILMPTAWFVFAFWLVVWWATRGKVAPNKIECCILGIIIGITATLVANILLLVPLVLAALIIKSKASESRRWKNVLLGAALLIAGLSIGTAPCWIHNYIIARDPVFLSAHSGVNFWIGNNPDSNGYPRFPPGLHAGQAAMLQDSVTQAESLAGRSLKHAEVSAFWSAKAKQYISRHFRDWLRLLGLKIRNFWSAFQYDDLSVITNLREQGVIFPGCYFGLVAALAIPGLFFTAWSRPQSRWIVLAILLSMFGLLAVFITERYRVVAVPGLLILGAGGLSILWESCLSLRIPAAVSYLALLAGSTILVSWPQGAPSLWALDAYNSGWQALESSNLPLAEQKLAIAYAYVPENSETNFALANLRLAENNRNAAKLFYRATLQIDPNHKGALNNLGVIALEDKQYGEAKAWLLHAEAVDPRNAKTHYLLAKALLMEGDRQAAQDEIETAIRLKPNQTEFTALERQLGSNPR